MKFKLGCWTLIIIVAAAFVLPTVPKILSGDISIGGVGGLGAIGSITEIFSPKEKKSAKETFIDETSPVGYNDALRYPSDYQGHKVRFEGKVFDISDSGGNITLLVQVYDKEDPYQVKSIYVDYTRNPSGVSFLKDDYITLYGKLNGLKTYNTVQGHRVTIPYIQAEYIDLDREL